MGQISEIKIFSLNVIPEEIENYEPDKSVLCHKGKNTGLVVGGAFLHAQYSISDQYVLFVEGGAMFEETLYIHLIDENFEILDWIKFSWIYSGATMTRLSIISRDVFEFIVFDCRWRLKVHETHRFRVPVPWGPDGAWRKASWKTYFSLSKLRT